MTIPTAIAEFGEGCWILHEFNGAKWQYFENTSAAAVEVKKVSGYEGQAVSLRKNVTTRLKEERAHDSVRGIRQQRHSEARRGRCESSLNWRN